jgi:hypothetical protein
LFESTPAALRIQGGWFFSPAEQVIGQWVTARPVVQYLALGAVICTPLGTAS